MSDEYPRSWLDDRWTDWLASSGYGIDYSGPADPPCTLSELADAYVRTTGEEDRAAWEWCITENTGAFATHPPHDAEMAAARDADRVARVQGEREAS